jgi:hypothetical protein
MEGLGFYRGIVWYARVSIVLLIIAIVAEVSGAKAEAAIVSLAIHALFPILVGGALHSVQKRIAKLEEDIQALRKGQ